MLVKVRSDFNYDHSKTIKSFLRENAKGIPPALYPVLPGGGGKGVPCPGPGWGGGYLPARTRTRGRSPCLD